MELYVKFLIAAVIWAIVGAIGFILLFLYSTPPQILSLAEILGIMGALGSWLSVTTSATMWGQRRALRRQDEMLKRQDEMLQLLREIRDAIIGEGSRFK